MPRLRMMSVHIISKEHEHSVKSKPSDQHMHTPTQTQLQLTHTHAHASVHEIYFDNILSGVLYVI